MSIKSLKIEDSVIINRIPRFITDFPSGSIRDRLASVLEMRALIKLICLQVDHFKYRVVDKNDKTNLYLVFERNRLKQGYRSNQTFTICNLIPIKGYDKFKQKMDHWLQTNGFTLFREDILEKVLEYNPRHPNDYSSKIDIKLLPNMTTGVAIKAILVNLFNTMKINQQGIIEDIDSEFLHDYRVAIRRIRSVFSQVKDVFSDETYMRAKKDFKSMGQLTNRMRDLDVYLLKEEEYQMMLPIEMRGNIKPFFVHTRRERKIEHKKLVNKLKSSEYSMRMNYWDKFINSTSSKKQQGLKSEKDVLMMAKCIIWKRYMRVIKFGDGITNTSPDPMLHRLRIECKKLRYLLEFFSSLFIQDEINYLVKQLKKLQDNLGAYNDLCIQQNTLHDYIKLQSNKNTLLAVGVLIGKLHDTQLRVRNSFANSYNRFASQTIKAKFKHLFGVTRRIDP